jgi:hypothetical protein
MPQRDVNAALHKTGDISLRPREVWRQRHQANETIAGRLPSVEFSQTGRSYRLQRVSASKAILRGDVRSFHVNVRYARGGYGIF